MRRYILFIMIGVLFIFIFPTSLLTGCHGKHEIDAFETPDTFDESRTYEITFWAKNDTNIKQTEIYEQAIEDFEKLYPNITVTIRLYTDYGKIYNDVITNMATGTTPNVCITYPDHIATYMKGDAVVNLDGLIENEKYGFGGDSLKFDGPDAGQMVDKFMDECVINNAHYALPFMRSTEVCYINKTFVEALGYELPDELTWDFIWEVSEKAAQKDEDGVYYLNGQQVMIPFIYKSTDNMMIQMLNQKNPELYCDSHGKIGLFGEETENLLYEISSHVASGAFSTFKISGYPANFLNAGQCVFAVDSTAGSTWMGAQAPLSDISNEDIVQFETAVMRLPQFDNNSPLMISQGPSVCIFNKEDPQEVLASWLFAQYLLTNEVQIAYSSTEGYIPVTNAALDSAEYRDYLKLAGSDNDLHYATKIEATQILIDNLQYTFTAPAFDGSTSLRDAAGMLIENVSKSTRRKESIDDSYMNEMFDEVKALYRLDEIGSTGGGVNASGPLPIESKVLIISVISVWILIIIVKIATKSRR